ncbi:NUMOD4 motif-containing HNH endonuclease [Microbacterium resistens]|uniref:NUMOD4 motif-containing HNH endonuclease n=1 Tax=Microbacterium resistens TaxID=156977 RepID=A0ABY3RUT3_9MICO|nr:NUMOD4 motif-containing HNH endonuclease [Microbacterium resistens]UGS27597.1 NUMOD4 motif-containing HNH endonuclease [Microbacterium resistens]
MTEIIMAIDPVAAHHRWIREFEEWRPVVGYEGKYEVSNLGRVRSLSRLSSSGRRVRGRMMGLRPHPRGYLQTTLTANGICETKKVHRLVLEAFVGPCPDGMESCHENGVRDDNRLSNLRWDTSLANAADRTAHGTQRGLAQTHCKRGHELVEPNLVRWHIKHTGRRLCAACNRAVKRLGTADGRMQALSDAFYAEIMKEAA